MQLPRGTFRSIKKGQTAPGLLQEMESLQFSGSCTLSWGRERSTLVLDKGRVVLAEHQMLRGDAALNGIRALSDKILDAELSDLNLTQLSLATEFNKQYIIQDSQRSTITFGKNVPGTQPETKPPQQTVPPARTFPEKRIRSPGKEVQENDWLDDIKETDLIGIVNKDLASLERIDLESMTEKIRNTCKSTVQRLDLGHLMEEKSGK